MAKRSELLDYLIDQLLPLGDARGRAMFGGHGIYLDGLIVGLIAWDTFYLKVDDGNRADFEAAGAEPFTYEGKGKPIIMSYWSCPPEVLEDPDTLRNWTLKAMAASRRTRQSTAAPRGKKSAAVGQTHRPTRRPTPRQR
ncbi:MAG: TfoX/Sxy family protein [Dongiaceae bacterium]